MTVAAIYRTTIGKKVLMALTGFIWVGYVILHMFGNLKVFLGANAINGYAEWLRTFGEELLTRGGVLWLVRLVLLAAIVVHVTMAYQLTRLDLESRPVRYSNRQYLQATFASRTMRWGGVAILLFLIYHILHMTTGTLHPNFVEGDVYHNVTVAFQNPVVAGIYILAMVALGLHLYHGTWSMLQTLGVNAFAKNNVWHLLAQAVAIIVPVGFVSVPIAILLGVVR